MTKTVQAKSDQLNADDLVGGPITIKITKVTACSGDQPISICYQDNDRPYKPNLAMRRVLVAAWGKNGEDYVGRSITLFCDPSVKWAGKEVGGIRISHLSDIKNAIVLPIAITRGKKIPYKILPLADLEVQREQCIAALREKGIDPDMARINAATSHDDLAIIYKESTDGKAR